MNLRAVGFVDTSMMTANLLVRHRDQLGSGVLVLREDGTDKPILTNFKSAKTLLTRIQRTLALPDFSITRAEVVMLLPDEHHEWRRETGPESEGLLRVHVCLVPSPAAWLYCGGEAMVAPVGQLVVINHRALHSAVNFGQVARTHLEIDLAPNPDPTE